MWGAVFGEVATYVMVVDKDVRVVYYDGDDCRWWCVLKEVLGVQLSVGVWCG